MNIRLPKPQYAIAALRQIRFAGAVPVLIGLLDSVQLRVLGWVAVPEIAVPLNHQPRGRYQHVNDKLTADDLLLLVSNAEAVQNNPPRKLQAIHFWAGREAQDPFFRVAFGVYRVITAYVA